MRLCKATQDYYSEVLRYYRIAPYPIREAVVFRPPPYRLQLHDRSFRRCNSGFTLYTTINYGFK